MNVGGKTMCSWFRSSNSRFNEAVASNRHSFSRGFSHSWFQYFFALKGKLHVYGKTVEHRRSVEYIHTPFRLVWGSPQLSLFLLFPSLSSSVLFFLPPPLPLLPSPHIICWLVPPTIAFSTTQAASFLILYVSVSIICNSAVMAVASITH